MKINCYLDSIGNVKLFSYIVPNKFENFKMLQESKMLDITGFALTFLNRNGFTNDLQLLNNKLIYSYNGNDKKNNFTDVDYRQMNELDITYDDNVKSSVVCLHADDINYNNCEIDDIKFDKIDKSISALKCKLYNDSLLINLKSGHFCILSRDDSYQMKKCWELT